MPRVCAGIGLYLALAGPVSIEAAEQPSAQDPPPARADADGSSTGFDLRYLSGSARDADLSRYVLNGDIAPGRYRMTLRLNGESVASEEVEFLADPSGRSSRPCLRARLLQRLGIEVPGADEQDQCVDLAQRIAQADVQVDFGELAIGLSVPQAALRRSARGAVDPALWQHGEAAVMLGYSYSQNQVRGEGGDADSAYLGLELGASLGAWRYRQRSSLSRSEGASWRGTTQASYLERAVPRWSGRLQLGRATAGDASLGVYGFRGLRLAKDERMVPDSLRGYAPVVRGTAYSNAVVEVSQRGNLLHRSNVAPGPFEIADLYAAGNGGDLEVAVIEADGRVARFRVPNAFNPQLRRAGSLGYELVLGQVDESSLTATPGVAQASAQYGFSNRFTGYGGALLSRGYASAVLGSAWNTPVGAFSLDANPVQVDGFGTAWRWRGGFNRRFEGSEAVVSASFSGYSERAHLDLYSALRLRQSGRVGPPLRALRDSAQIALNWPLGERGSLYLSGSRVGYRGGGSHSNYQAGLRWRWRSLGLALTAARLDDPLGGREDQYFLGLNLPLGRSATADASLERRARGDAARIGLSGSAGADSALSYGLSLADADLAGRSGNANAQYRLPFATLNGAYGWSRGHRQRSWGADGVAVLHAGGLTIGPQYGETLALVEAPGAHGARVLNQAGARVDRRGYALAAYLVPYARNTVEVDPLSAHGSVNIAGTSQTFAPYAGALVRLTYASEGGRGAIFHLRRSNGSGLPFAAEVLDEDGRIVGAVAQASRVHATGLRPSGRLRARWGAAAEQACSFDYALPPPARERTNAYAIIEAHCSRSDAP